MRAYTCALAGGMIAAALGVSSSAAAQDAPGPLPAPTDSTQASPNPAPPANPEAAAPARGAGSQPVWLGPQHAAPGEDRSATQAAHPGRDLSRNFWMLSLGVRNSWIRDAGYDPFSTNDSLTQVSLHATRTLVVSGNVSIAAGLVWEGGGSDATARGARSSLSVNRFGGIGEIRYHFHRDLYALFKFVPHAIYASAKLEEASAPANLIQKDWRFGADLTAGAAWNFPRTLGAGPTVPEFWLAGEFGYGFTTRNDLLLKPDLDESDPRSTTRMGLGSLSLSGLLMRATVAMTF